MADLIVYSVPGSPYGRSVLATLEEKGATYRFSAVAVVGASVAGRAPVLQNVQGRFVRGGTKWLVHDLVVLKPGG